MTDFHSIAGRLAFAKPTCRKAAVAALAIAVAGSAHAVTYIWPASTGVGNPIHQDTYSNYTYIEDASLPVGHAPGGWGGISFYEVTGFGDVIDLCIEKNTAGWDSSYDVKSLTSASQVSASQAHDIDLLITNALPDFLALRDTYKAAAAGSAAANSAKAIANDYALGLQLAVWEIMQETSGTLNLAPGQATSGSFYLPGHDVAADNYGISFIDNITSGAWTATGAYRLSYGDSALRQDRLLISAVPEPGTVALMLGGFGLLGFAGRGRGSKRIGEA